MSSMIMSNVSFSLNNFSDDKSARDVRFLHHIVMRCLLKRKPLENIKIIYFYAFQFSIMGFEISLMVLRITSYHYFFVKFFLGILFSVTSTSVETFLS